MVKAVHGCHDAREDGLEIISEKEAVASYMRVGRTTGRRIVLKSDLVNRNSIRRFSRKSQSKAMALWTKGVAPLSKRGDSEDN